MSGNGSDNSSPADFAFEPPSSDTAFDNASFKPNFIKTPLNGNAAAAYNPTTGSVGNNFAFSNSFPSYGISSASSFSSASGSATGDSFSSVDALPAISRDFARPSATETRRPATAGGALQSRSPFAGYMPGGEEGQRFQRLNQRASSAEDAKTRVETIDEGSEAMFTDPFGTPNRAEEESKQIPSQSPTTIDPHFVPQNRRASEPQFNIPNNVTTSANWQTSPYSSQADSASLGLTSAPAHVAQVGYLQQQQLQNGNQVQALPRQAPYSGRPQTSDGLPSYPHLHGGVALPSAQSIARQIPGLSSATGYYPSTSATARHDQQVPVSLMPFRDDRSASTGNIQHALPGTFPGDRAYSIDSGMARAAGRQAYVQMPGSKPGDLSQSELTFVQLGGPTPKKRPRRRFDEIERLYSCGWNGCEKSYGTLNHLNAHVAMQKHGEKRLPTEFKDMRKAWRKKKRESAAASANAQYANGGAPAWSQRVSISSQATDSDWDRRDSSSSMMSGSSNFSHRSSVSYAPNYSWTESRPTTSSSIASADGRTYFHPGAQYGVPPSNYMPPPRRLSAPQHLPIPASAPNGLEGFRQSEGDHLTPTAQNPFPQRQGFPFTTLTSPMPGQNAVGVSGEGPYGGHFAFQR